MNFKFDVIYKKLLSSTTRKKTEQFFLVIAILSFIIHLAIISLVYFDVISLNKTSNLFKSPISAIYTPFSFILIYEVYLLIYYLPQSLTIYINKQYEIILLIIMRRLFKDLANLKISADWFSIKYDLQFTYDILTTLLLFFLIYLFYKQSKKRFTIKETDESILEGTLRYTKIKKIIASLLVPVVLVLAVYSFTNWISETIFEFENSGELFQNINNIFFEQFFTVLVIVDVILLLVSFFYTDKFHLIIRNSGFIVSTILIRLSFSVEGLMNNLLVVIAVLFGLTILIIYNKFEQNISLEKPVNKIDVR
ncbi:MAG: hypothetical protein R6W85_05445 [Gillisia sp.]